MVGGQTSKSAEADEADGEYLEGQAFRKLRWQAAEPELSGGSQPLAKQRLKDDKAPRRY